MAVKCWNCRSSDTTTGGGELLSCLTCGAVMDQHGDPPDLDNPDHEYPVTTTATITAPETKAKAKK